MGHRQTLLALALVAAASCGGSSPARISEPLIWVAPRPLEPILPGIPRNGDSATLLDLVAMPLGRLFPAATKCPGRETCELALTPARSFQDGAAIEPRDVVAAIRRYLHPEGEAWFSIAGNRLSLRLPRSAMALIPWVSVAERDRGGRWVGSGPYRIVSQGPKRIDLRAVSPTHRPHEIVAESVAGPRAVFTRLLAGRADVAIGLLLAHERLLKASGRIGDSVLQKNIEVVLVFNEKSPALKDAAVRRCLAAAISPAFRRLSRRLGLLPSPRSLQEIGAPGSVAPGCAARLAQLTTRLGLELVDLDEARMANEALLVSLADAGVRTRTRSISLKDMATPMAADLRLSFINMVHPQAPALYVGSDDRMNVGHHHDPALDAMLARGATWKAVGAHLADDPPFVPLGVFPRVAVTSKRFRFVHPNPDGSGAFSVALSIRPAKAH